MRTKISYRELSNSVVAEVTIEGDEDNNKLNSEAQKLFSECQNFAKLKTLEKTR
jgi:hypothetical protein